LQDLDQVEDHVNNYRFIDKKKFTEMVRIFEKEFNRANPKNKLKVPISDTQIETLFVVLDIDGNG